MTTQPIKLTFNTNEAPKTYTVTITDKETGEEVQKYDTKIALLFGVQDGDEKQSLPLMMIQLGNGFQIAKLLGILNNTVSDYLASIFEREQKMNKKGKSVG